MLFSSKFTPIEIKNLKEEGRLILRNTLLDMKKLYVSDKRSSKLLIVTSKKVGNAPYRNYLRRCTKIIMHEFATAFRGIHTAIFFKKQTNRVTFHQIRAMLCGKLQKKL